MIMSIVVVGMVDCVSSVVGLNARYARIVLLIKLLLTKRLKIEAKRESVGR